MTAGQLVSYAPLGGVLVVVLVLGLAAVLRGYSVSLTPRKPPPAGTRQAAAGTAGQAAGEAQEQPRTISRAS